MTGLYVHWPFCVAKCPYCDFNSHVRERVDEDQWRDALLRELDWTAAWTGPQRLTTIFFGGGTPSLMSPATVAAVIARADQRFSLTDDAEITLEANPNSVDVARFRGYRDAGVNRVSLGVQALDDAALKQLGRAHDSREALAAIDVAAGVFDRFTFDLIYARQGQTRATWMPELERALALARGHLSLYQLTIEPGTAFHARHARGDLVLPDEDESAALFHETQARMEAAGMPAYEVSNHARPGQESRHNLIYWRYQDYIGIGPGAHGRIKLRGQLFATQAEKAPESWAAKVAEQGHGLAARDLVTPEEAGREALMMGLRLSEGIDVTRVAARIGRPLDVVLDGARLQRLLDAGMVERTSTQLRATAKGRPVLNAVIAALIA